MKVPLVHTSNTVLKAIALVLANAFLLNEFAFGAVGLAPSDLAILPVPLFSFKLPISVAVVEDHLKVNPSQKSIVLLQDAHTNESGQLNIAKAIDLIIKKEKIRTVFVEAGFDDVSLTSLKDKAPLEKRRRVALSYLKQGELSGSEYLNLTSEEDFTLWGVEDKELYWKSIEVYRAIAKERERFQDYLRRIETTIAALKPLVFNPALNSFDRKHEDFLKEKIPLTDYFTVLADEAGKLGLPIGYYPHLEALYALKEKEKSIDFRKANEEEQKAAASLPKEELEELLENSGEHSVSKLYGNGRRNQEAFYWLLKEKLEKGRPAINRVTSTYPELSKYFDYLTESKKLDPRRILEEERLLEKEVYGALIGTADERKLHEASKNLRSLQALLNLTLTPDEFHSYETDPKAFDITSMTGFLNKKIMDLKNHYERVVFLENGYEDIVKKCGEFYYLTLQRDIAFIRNMTRKMDEEAQKKAILITGGYHSPNVKALLKAANISYVSVSPQILQETNLKRYEKLLLSQIPPVIARSEATKQSPGRSPRVSEYVGARDDKSDKIAIWAIRGRTSSDAVNATLRGWKTFVGDVVVPGLETEGRVDSSFVRRASATLDSGQTLRYSFDVRSGRHRRFDRGGVALKDQNVALNNQDVASKTGKGDLQHGDFPIERVQSSNKAWDVRDFLLHIDQPFTKVIEFLTHLFQHYVIPVLGRVLRISGRLRGLFGHVRNLPHRSRFVNFSSIPQRKATVEIDVSRPYARAAAPGLRNAQRAGGRLAENNGALSTFQLVNFLTGAKGANAARLAVSDRRQFLKTAASGTIAAGVAVSGMAPVLDAVAALDALQHGNSIEYAYDKTTQAAKVIRNGRVLDRKAHIGAVVYTNTGKEHPKNSESRPAEQYAALFGEKELFVQEGSVVARDPEIAALSADQKDRIRKKTAGDATRIKRLGVTNILTRYLSTDDSEQVAAAKSLFQRLKRDYGIGVTGGHWIGGFDKPDAPRLAGKSEDDQQKVGESVERFVETYADVLDAINLGNELNYNKSFPFVDEEELIAYQVRMAAHAVRALRRLNEQRAKEGKGPIQIPVSIGFGGLTDNQAKLVKKYNEIWEKELGEKPVKAIAANLYPSLNHKTGKWGGDVSLIDRAAKSAQLAELPLIIQEINIPNQTVDGQSNAQAQVKFWEEVMKAVTRNPNILRVTVFQWGDQEWKIAETKNPVEGHYGLSPELEQTGLFSNWDLSATQAPSGRRLASEGHPDKLASVVTPIELSDVYGYNPQNYSTNFRKVSKMPGFPATIRDAKSKAEKGYVLFEFTAKDTLNTFKAIVRQGDKPNEKDYIVSFTRDSKDGKWYADDSKKKATFVIDAKNNGETAISLNDLEAFFGNEGPWTEFHLKHGKNEGNDVNENLIGKPSVGLSKPASARLAVNRRGFVMAVAGLGLAATGIAQAPAQDTKTKTSRFPAAAGHRTNLKVLIDEDLNLMERGGDGDKKYLNHLRKFGNQPGNFKKLPQNVGGYAEAYLTLNFKQLRPFKNFKVLVRGVTNDGKEKDYLLTFYRDSEEAKMWFVDGGPGVQGTMQVAPNGDDVEVAIEGAHLKKFFGDSGRITEIQVKQGMKEGNKENENITPPKVGIAKPSAAPTRLPSGGRLAGFHKEIELLANAYLDEDHSVTIQIDSSASRPWSFGYGRTSAEYLYRIPQELDEAQARLLVDSIFKDVPLGASADKDVFVTEIFGKGEAAARLAKKQVNGKRGMENGGDALVHLNGVMEIVSKVTHIFFHVFTQGVHFFVYVIDFGVQLVHFNLNGAKLALNKLKIGHNKLLDYALYGIDNAGHSETPLPKAYHAVVPVSSTLAARLADLNRIEIEEPVSALDPASTVQVNILSDPRLVDLGNNGTLAVDDYLAKYEGSDRGAVEGAFDVLVRRAFFGPPNGQEHRFSKTESVRSAARLALDPDTQARLHAVALRVIKPSGQLTEAALHTHLYNTAKAMVPSNGGIMAADESVGSMLKWLEPFGLSNEGVEGKKNRQAARSIIARAARGLKQRGIDSIILDRDTFDNIDTETGKRLIDMFKEAGILIGLKTDAGLIDDPQSLLVDNPDPKKRDEGPVRVEKLPKPNSIPDLTGLLEQFADTGIVFTKWRVVTATDAAHGLPREENIRANMKILARSAKMTQLAGLVPIVEPEVLFDGGHDINASYNASVRAIQILFEELKNEGVWLDGIVLKTSMVLSGKSHPKETRADSRTVGYQTLKALLKSVPGEVPAIVFLSGGQGDDEVNKNLNAVSLARLDNATFESTRDEAVRELESEGKDTTALRAFTQETLWEISYSFGRGLVGPGYRITVNDPVRVPQAVQALYQAAEITQKARTGHLAAARLAQEQEKGKGLKGNGNETGRSPFTIYRSPSGEAAGGRLASDRSNRPTATASVPDGWTLIRSEAIPLLSTAVHERRQTLGPIAGIPRSAVLGLHASGAVGSDDAPRVDRVVTDSYRTRLQTAANRLKRPVLHVNGEGAKDYKDLLELKQGSLLKGEIFEPETLRGALWKWLYIKLPKYYWRFSRWARGEHLLVASDPVDGTSNAAKFKGLKGQEGRTSSFLAVGENLVPISDELRALGISYNDMGRGVEFDLRAHKGPGELEKAFVEFVKEYSRKTELPPAEITIHLSGIFDSKDASKDRPHHKLVRDMLRGDPELKGLNIEVFTAGTNTPQLLSGMYAGHIYFGAAGSTETFTVAQALAGMKKNGITGVKGSVQIISENTYYEVEEVDGYHEKKKKPEEEKPPRTRTNLDNRSKFSKREVELLRAEKKPGTDERFYSDEMIEQIRQGDHAYNLDDLPKAALQNTLYLPTGYEFNTTTGVMLRDDQNPFLKPEVTIQTLLVDDRGVRMLREIFVPLHSIAPPGHDRIENSVTAARLATEIDPATQARLHAVALRVIKPSSGLSVEDIHQHLIKTSKAMVPPNGGVMAADESVGSMLKWLEPFGLSNDGAKGKRNRQAARGIIAKAAQGLKLRGIHSIILDRDTFDNTDPETGKLLIDMFKEAGILIGLKTDAGLIDDTQSSLVDNPDPKKRDKGPVRIEKLPKPNSIPDLTGLLEAHADAGIVFTKWRVVTAIDKAHNLPREENIRENMRILARSAKMTQLAGLVPIVEPEILFDGAHDITASYNASVRAIQILFEELKNEGVWLDGIVLKTSMVLSGKSRPKETRADSKTVGYQTLKALLKSVLKEVPAIVFLSGGQGDDEVNRNLNAVSLARLDKTTFEKARDEAAKELEDAGKDATQLRLLTQAPWEISYSFGRGLVGPGYRITINDSEKVPQAIQALYTAAEITREARVGRLTDTVTAARLAGTSSIEIPVYRDSHQIVDQAIRDAVQINSEKGDPEKGAIVSVQPISTASARLAAGTDGGSRLANQRTPIHLSKDHQIFNLRGVRGFLGGIPKNYQIVRIAGVGVVNGRRKEWFDTGNVAGVARALRASGSKLFDLSVSFNEHPKGKDRKGYVVLISPVEGARLAQARRTETLGGPTDKVAEWPAKGLGKESKDAVRLLEKVFEGRVSLADIKIDKNVLISPANETEPRVWFLAYHPTQNPQEKHLLMLRLKPDGKKFSLETMTEMNGVISYVVQGSFVILSKDNLVYFYRWAEQGLEPVSPKELSNFVMGDNSKASRILHKSDIGIPGVLNFFKPVNSMGTIILQFQDRDIPMADINLDNMANGIWTPYPGANKVQLLKYDSPGSRRFSVMDTVTQTILLDEPLPKGGEFQLGGPVIFVSWPSDVKEKKFHPKIYYLFRGRTQFEIRGADQNIRTFEVLTRLFSVTGDTSTVIADVNEIISGEPKPRSIQQGIPIYEASTVNMVEVAQRAARKIEATPKSVDNPDLLQRVVAAAVPGYVEIPKHTQLERTTNLELNIADRKTVSEEEAKAAQIISDAAYQIAYGNLQNHPWAKRLVYPKEKVQGVNAIVFKDPNEGASLHKALVMTGDLPPYLERTSRQFVIGISSDGTKVLFKVDGQYFAIDRQANLYSVSEDGRSVPVYGAARLAGSEFEMKELGLKVRVAVKVISGDAEKLVADFPGEAVLYRAEAAFFTSRGNVPLGVLRFEYSYPLISEEETTLRLDGTPQDLPESSIQMAERLIKKFLEGTGQLTFLPMAKDEISLLIRLGIPPDLKLEGFTVFVNLNGTSFELTPSSIDSLLATLDERVLEAVTGKLTLSNFKIDRNQHLISMDINSAAARLANLRELAAVGDWQRIIAAAMHTYGVKDRPIFVLGQQVLFKDLPDLPGRPNLKIDRRFAMFVKRAGFVEKPDGRQDFEKSYKLLETEIQPITDYDIRKKTIRHVRYDGSDFLTSMDVSPVNTRSNDLRTAVSANVDDKRRFHLFNATTGERILLDGQPHIQLKKNKPGTLDYETKTPGGRTIFVLTLPNGQKARFDARGNKVGGRLAEEIMPGKSELKDLSVGPLLLKLGTVSFALEAKWGGSVLTVLDEKDKPSSTSHAFGAGNTLSLSSHPTEGFLRIGKADYRRIKIGLGGGTVELIGQTNTQVLIRNSSNFYVYLEPYKPVGSRLAEVLKGESADGNFIGVGDMQGVDRIYVTRPAATKGASAKFEPVPATQLIEELTTWRTRGLLPQDLVIEEVGGSINFRRPAAQQNLVVAAGDALTLAHVLNGIIAAGARLAGNRRSRPQVPMGESHGGVTKPPGNIGLIVVPHKTAVAREVARRIIEKVREKPDADFGLVAGSTANAIYDEVVRMFKEDSTIDFSRASAFTAGEYLGLIDPNHLQSYGQLINKQLFERLSETAFKRAFKSANVHFLGDSKYDVSQFLSEIKKREGIDLQILGVDFGGHYAFHQLPFSVNPALARRINPKLSPRSSAYKGVRDSNEFILDSGIDEKQLSPVIVKILRLRRDTRSRLGHYGDLVAELKAARNETKKPALPDRILKEELDELGKRLLAESEATFYLPNYSRALAEKLSEDMTDRGLVSVSFKPVGALTSYKAETVSLAVPTILNISPPFGGLVNVPIRGIALGEMVPGAKEVILAAYGSEKAGAIRDTLQKYAAPEMFESTLQGHRRAFVIVDELAASQIQYEIRHKAEDNRRHMARGEDKVRLSVETLLSPTAYEVDRIEAAEELGELGDKATEGVILALSRALMMKDGPHVRSKVAQALSLIGEKAYLAGPSLIAVLKTEPDAKVRSDAILALVRIGKGTLPGLREALRDSSETVRSEALDAIRGMGEAARDTVPLLRDMAEKDSVADIQKKASDVLREMKVTAPPDIRAERFPSEAAIARYQGKLNKARGMELRIGRDVKETGALLAVAIIKAIQDWQAKLPRHKKVVIHFATGESPWLGYAKLAEFLNTWDDPFTRETLTKYGVDLEKGKPDMSRVLALPLDAIFPQRRTDYHAFPKILSDMFDKLGIPKENRLFFYGDIKDASGKKAMGDREFEKLLSDIEENGLSLAEDSRIAKETTTIQRRFLRKMIFHAKWMTRQIEKLGGAHIVIAGVGPSYEGKGHVAFMESGTPLDQKAFISPMGYHVAAAHSKENGGMDRLYTRSTKKTKYGFITFGWHELLYRNKGAGDDPSEMVQAIIIATGAPKSSSVQKMIEAEIEGDYDSSYPVTGFRKARGVFILDPTAAKDLRLFQNPWEFEHMGFGSETESQERELRRFFIRLAKDTGRKIRTLVTQDGLPSYAGAEGELFEIAKRNVEDIADNAWNFPKDRVAETIGKNLATPEEAGDKDHLGLPLQSKIVLISPHLDDDFLAYRDLIKAWVKQGHRVSSYYVTPGYTAVHDSYLAEALGHIRSWDQEKITREVQRLDVLASKVRKLSRVVKKMAEVERFAPKERFRREPDLKKRLKSLRAEVYAPQKELLGRLTKVIESGDVHQAKRPDDFEVWDPMSAEEKDLRASLLFLYLNLDSLVRLGKVVLDKKEKVKAFTDFIFDAMRGKRLWGSLDLEVVQGMKSYLRLVEARTALASLGVGPEEIYDPLKATWYKAGLRGTAEPKDIEDLEDIYKEKNPDLIVVNGEGFPDYGAHSTTEASAIAAVRHWMDSPDYPKGHSLKILQYAGVWEKISVEDSDLTVVISRGEMEEFDRAFRNHYPSQAPAAVPDPGLSEPLYFSEQVRRNALATRREIEGLIDIPEKYHALFSDPETTALNYKLLDINGKAVLEKFDRKVAEMKRVKTALDAIKGEKFHGPVPQADILAMSDRLDAIRKAGLPWSSVLSKREMLEILAPRQEEDSVEGIVHRAKELFRNPEQPNGARMADVTKLISQLISSNSKNRLAAAVSLSKLGGEAEPAIDELIKRLDPRVETDSLVRSKAAQALGLIGRRHEALELAKERGRGEMTPYQKKLIFGPFSKEEFIELLKKLEGKRIGILGFGVIGEEVAKKLNELRKVLQKLTGGSFEIVAASPSLRDPASKRAAVASELGVQIVDEDVLYQTSDIVTVHIPSTDANKQYIKPESFAGRTKRLILVDTARRDQVDDALLREQQSFELTFFGDVDFDKEIVAIRDAHEQRVFITPHIGGLQEASAQGVRKNVLAALRDLFDVLLGKKAPASIETINPIPIVPILPGVKGDAARLAQLTESATPAAFAERLRDETVAARVEVEPLVAGRVGLTGNETVFQGTVPPEFFSTDRLEEFFVRTALALDKEANGNLALANHIFTITFDGRQLIAHANEFPDIVISDVKTLPKNNKVSVSSALTLQDLRMLSEAVDRKVNAALDGVAIQNTPEILEVDPDFLPPGPGSFDFYGAFLLTVLQGEKNKPYGHGVYYLAVGKQGARLAALPGAAGLFLDSVSPDLKNVTRVSLAPAGARLRKGVVNVPLRALQDGEIPAFSSAARLAIYAGRIDTADPPERFRDGWAALAGERPEKSVLHSILDGLAQAEIVLRFALKAITRVSLDAAVRFFRMREKQFDQAA